MKQVQSGNAYTVFPYVTSERNCRTQTQHLAPIFHIPDVPLSHDIATKALP